MSETAAFEIISPERVVLSEQAEMIVVPGAEGDFGVLPGHAPFISGLRPGVVTIYDKGAPAKRIFVGGGVAETTPDGCTVLAEEATPVEDLDAAELRKVIADLQDDIRDAQDDAGRRAAETALAVAEAKLAAAG